MLSCKPRQHGAGFDGHQAASQCERCADLVKRAMNRPPQEADCRGRQGRGADCADPHCRFHTHQKTCGGAYVKVCAPAGDVLS